MENYRRNVTQSRTAAKSTLGSLLSAGSYLAGGYHGYMDAQGNPMSEKLEDTLTWVPAATGAVLGGIGGLVGGAIGGAGLGHTLKGKVLGGAVVGSVTGVALGATTGGLYRGFQTLVGYGLGYLVGVLSR